MLVYKPHTPHTPHTPVMNDFFKLSSFYSLIFKILIFYVFNLLIFNFLIFLVHGTGHPLHLYLLAVFVDNHHLRINDL